MTTIVIPMAGRGSRFFKQGFRQPKYMINARGKSLFEHSMAGLPLSWASRLVFVCLEEHKKWDVEGFIRDHVDHPDVHILFIAEVTRGQAETVLMARELIDPHRDLLIYNIDTYFQSSELESALRNPLIKKDGVVGAFIDESEDEKWSFARVDKHGRVVETREKQKISNYALTGLYHFTHADDFLRIAETHIARGSTEAGEYYIAPMYNDLISEGKDFRLDFASDFIALGTPEEVASFVE